MSGCQLIDASRGRDGIDALREAMALVLQELIDLEAIQAIGARRDERGVTGGPTSAPPTAAAGTAIGWP